MTDRSSSTRGDPGILLRRLLADVGSVDVLTTALQSIGTTAETIVGIVGFLSEDRLTHGERLRDLVDRPERHAHDIDGLAACCTIGGAIDLALMDAHSRLAPLGRNGGVACDVTRGPCACGAWH